MLSSVLRDDDTVMGWALTLSRCSAAVANYCDHIEHNEVVDRAWVLDAGREMRSVSCAFASREDVDLKTLFAARLRAVEKRNPLWTPETLDGGTLVEAAETWRDLQVAQSQHDRVYHPDVIGLSKFDQLRHYALHTAKLAGAVAELADGSMDTADFMTGRLPDLLLFGIKLSTVSGERLPDVALARDRRTTLTAA